MVVYRFMNSERTAAHAYYVKSYQNNSFDLINPWGFDNISLTWDQFKVECYGFVTLKPVLIKI